MAANRHKHIRAANCRTVKDVEMAPKHNDMNVLCIGADYVSWGDIYKMVTASLQQSSKAEGIKRE